MRVLIACEYSGRVRDAFIKRGHYAMSCDLLPSESPLGEHWQGDIEDALIADDWDLLIAHPPCTYLSVSGLHWNTRGILVDGVPRADMTEKALQFVQMLMNAKNANTGKPIDRICIENPVSCISSRIRKPDQIIQPWWFGEDASKKTCLWLKNLPPLVPTNRLDGNDRTRRANQTASGQNKLGPSPDRWKERSRTYQGIADAMAAQWGNL